MTPQTTVGWIGVDLDGTLAQYDGWKGPTHIGEPIPAMVERVKQWLEEGADVRIMTARVYPLGLIRDDDDISLLIGANERESTARSAAIAIRGWCLLHIGKILPVTCVKDYSLLELWDDRAIQVIPNLGLRADGKNERLPETLPGILCCPHCKSPLCYKVKGAPKP